ncbi:hypothetical protein TSUD_82900 [Trifolium subterraneum]|uniref:Uncharacterized protein n=1 Tax=Trifolium subterraneum TaxID=3900 RepID=A0A2Z6LLL1_TRISU|nr:hypothetical protein TSUD_82900 [Trifolium subterraneum]
MGSIEEDSLRLEEALIQDQETKLYTGDGSVDFKGRPVLKQNTGTWKACPFILGGSPLTRMCQVVAASFRKRNLAVPEDSSLLYETPDKSSAIEGSRKIEHSDELRLVFPYFEFTVAVFSALVTLVKNKGVCKAPICLSKPSLSHLTRPDRIG